MIILKTITFRTPDDIVMFVNVNRIKKEDILTITVFVAIGAHGDYTLFFYGDSGVKEITRGFTGW
jgi:hypothetical protein